MRQRLVAVARILVWCLSPSPRLAAAKWLRGVGCLWRPPHEAGEALAGDETARRISPSAILAHNRCCGVENSSGGQHTDDLPGVARLFAMMHSGAPADWDPAPELSREWDRARRGARLRCFPGPGEKYASFFNAGECCFRPFLDVDIVVAGVAKAGTTSMLHILGAHPDIVAASDSEFDAYAVSEAVTPMEVAVWNYFARQVRASKPGARLFAIGCPVLVFDQKKMWRIAQIPHVKVLLMLREPTSWLASAYNFFMEDCHRQHEKFKVELFGAIPSALCCLTGRRVLQHCRRMSLDAVPRFWEDVVVKEQPFSRAGFSRIAADFADALRVRVADMFHPRAVAYADLAALSLPADEAVEWLQRLGGFLGAARPFAAADLRRVLEETSRTLGGHMKFRLKINRINVCDGSVVSPAFANSLFAAERESLNLYLRARNADGSFVGVTKALFSPPCPALGHQPGGAEDVASTVAGAGASTCGAAAAREVNTTSSQQPQNAP